MAVVKPFKGVRYNTNRAGRLEDLITPPYDVISGEQQELFLERNQYNIVRLDLPKSPGIADYSQADRHCQAAKLLTTWRKTGILMQEEAECIYPYEVSYRLPNGMEKTRIGFICLVQLHAFSENIIKPHEQTFTTVIKDRLALTRACRAQFSQVFSVFHDPDHQVTDLLSMQRAQLASLNDGAGNNHRLWKISDRSIVESIENYLADTPLYIADGHHRYTTALAYRDEQDTSDGPENFIMMYLCPIEQDGMTILPTHRLVSMDAGFVLDDFLNAAALFFDIVEINHDRTKQSLPHHLVSLIEAESERAKKKHLPIFGLYLAEVERGFILRGNKHTRSTVQHREPSLQVLDVVVLNDAIFARLLGLDLHRSEQEHLVSYHSSVNDAILECGRLKATSDKNGQTLLFLLNGTAMDQVSAVSDAGLFMPHKSTFFYPKVMSGMVLNVFDK